MIFEELQCAIAIPRKINIKGEGNPSPLSYIIWATKEGKCSWCDLRAVGEPFIAPMSTLCANWKRPCPEVIARSGSFHEKHTEGKARFRQVVQRRTSPPLCFMDMPAQFALLACACLAERSEATCFKTSTRQDPKRCSRALF